MPLTQHTLLSFEDRFEQLQREQDDILARLEAQTLGNTQELADRLDSIHRRPENTLQQFPPWDSDPAVPLASNVEVLSETQDVGTTHLAVRWTNPDPAQIERFEIYTQRSAFSSESPAKVWEGHPPATFSITADQDTTVVGQIRTVMKGGAGGSTLGGSPTFASSITLADITAGDIADGSIGDAKLDRITDPIVIDTADIANLAVGTAQIANAAVDTAQIANAAISTALIQNAAITNALIGNLAVDTAQIAAAAITDAKIDSLSAAKITTGTLGAGIAVLGTVLAGQIQAGTMSAVNMSAGTYTLTSGNNTMGIDGTNGFNIDNTTIDVFFSVLNGQLRMRNLVANSRETFIDVDTVEGFNASGNSVWRLRSDTEDLGEANSGYLAISDAISTDVVELGVDAAGDGMIDLDGHLSLTEIGNTPANPASSTEARIYVRGDNLIIQFNDAGTVRYKYLDLTGTGVTWTHSTTAPT